MPSRAEMRPRLEQILRGVVVAALMVLLWRSLRASDSDAAKSIRARGINDRSLVEWSRGSAASHVHLSVDSLPVGWQRSWLRALAGSGTRITWSGDLWPMMIDAQPIAAPSGGTRVLLAADGEGPVVLRDEIGPLDTLRLQNVGASISIASLAGRISARAGGSIASAAQPDSLLLRRLLVIGAAGWESKFAVAALEENGWKVDALLRVAPGVDVRQGSPASIDTAHYSAVIAIDSTAANYSDRIAAYVTEGGGVILGPSARILTAATSAISVPIERRSGAVTAAASRVGAGRALRLSIDDTWRWRMTGDADGVAKHRAWWTGMVSRVAYAPSVPRNSASARDADGADAEESPYADLVSAIGSPTSGSGSASGVATKSIWTALLFSLFALALLAEIGSRRRRGLP